MEIMEPQGNMASSAVATAAPTATGSNGVSALQPKRIALLKRMLVDDDDDSSSSEHEALKPEIEESKPAKLEEDVAVESKPRLQRKSGSERKKKESKTKKKEKEPRVEKPRKEQQKPAKSKSETGIAPLKVRSERLQMREALKESTELATVVETPVKVVAPRKRPRSGEKEAKAAVVVEETKPKRPRMTRQESLEELEEEKRQRKSKKEESAKTRRDRIQRRGSKTSDDGEKETDAADVTVEEPAKEEEIEAKPEADAEFKRPRKKTREPQNDVVEQTTVETTVETTVKTTVEETHVKTTVETQVETQVEETKEVAMKVTKVVTPRRARAISTDGSDKEEELSKPKPRKARDQKRPVKSKEEKTVEDGDEQRERKRLKRPLSTTSNSSAKKTASLSNLLDRESGVNGEKAVERAASVASREKEDEKQRVKPSKEERKPLKRREDKPRSLDEFENTEREARGVKSKPKKRERVRDDPDSLDAYLKAKEAKRVSKGAKPERVVEDENGRENGVEQESSSRVRRLSEEVRVSIANLLTSDGDENGQTAADSGDANGNADVEKVPEPETPKNEDKAEEIAPPTSTKAASPVDSADSKKKAGPVDDVEEGAASDTDNAVEAVKSATVPEEAKVEEPAPANDPMSFVIPKKRNVSTTINREANRPSANGISAIRRAAPVPQASPVSSVESTPVAAAAPLKRRSKNAVPPRLAPITPREKEFLRLTKKSNSLFKAASLMTVQQKSNRGAKVQPRLVSAFGCTTDRYSVLQAPNVLFSEATTRMSCPTRTQIKSAKHPPAFFGVSMAAPPLVTAVENEKSKTQEAEKKKAIPSYETLEFERSDDREWYQQHMYGTSFVPQLLRERVTLVMHNARYERKATGMHFNAQRDKELYCEGLAQRYTMNRSVPRCDILARNWQQLASGRTSFVFLHYMNREDAEQAHRVFKDDEGQSLTFKNETRRMAAANGHASPAPARSPPPMPSPPQPPRRRSPSPRQGRYRDRGPWPPRDHNMDFRDDRGRRPYDGGPPLPPRSPPARPRGRSRSRSRSPRRGSHHDFASQSRELERGPPVQEPREQERVAVEELDRSKVEDKSQHSSQATTATHDSSMDGEEGQVLSQNDHSVVEERHGELELSQSSQISRSRSRSRSRQRFREMHDPHREPSHHRSRSPPGSQRGYDDRSFQQRDRRGNRELYGRGDGERRGSFGSGRSPGPSPQEWMDRDRHGRERDRYGAPGAHADRYGEHHVGHDHQHYRDQHPFHDNRDNRAPPVADDRRARQGSDDYRRQYDHRDHRGGRY